MRLQRQIIEALRGQLAGGKTRPPEGGVILWQAFNQLSRQRSWHMHGPNPIPVSEVEVWCRLMRVPLEPRHVGIILAMDRVWLDHILATMKPGATNPRPVSKSPMTPAIFDALFG